MNAIMNTEQFTTFEQIRDFLSGTREGVFPMPTKSSRYAFLQNMLSGFKYQTFGMADKGLLVRFLSQIIGLFQAAGQRLVQQVSTHRQAATPRTHGRANDVAAPCAGHCH